MPERSTHQTYKNTTQLGRVGAVKGLKLWKRNKAPNPALNTPRRNEPVATDTIYGAVPGTIDNGSTVTAAQIFIGRISGLCEAEGIGTSDKQYAEALANHIRRYGAMDQIISDAAKAQISKRVNELLEHAHDRPEDLRAVQQESELRRTSVAGLEENGLSACWTLTMPRHTHGS